MKWEAEELQFIEDNRVLIEAWDIVGIDKKIYESYKNSYGGVNYFGANCLHLALTYAIYGPKEFTIKIKGLSDKRAYLYLPDKYIRPLTYYKRIFENGGGLKYSDIITDLSEENCRKSLRAHSYWNSRARDLIIEIISEATFIG